ncbi:hypothetical protein BGZ99_002384 [Dissophora globulifera]|uniref:Uncharacterized protein n=1 Tax=Dissophora globulifera TaxID=979702 RepID=A0A9P6RSH9_9FUNG|nr:hypothetical protein BGZ99_002384 [Dissophora globulifera]
MVTPESYLGRLKVCSQAFLTAAYHCLFMATKTSCGAEESSWIGSGAGFAKGGGGVSSSGTTTAAGALSLSNHRSSFLERDWANGRLYYEAHYIFRLGLEDLIAFMRTEPAAAKLYSAFEQPMRDLKIESDAHVK